MLLTIMIIIMQVSKLLCWTIENTNFLTEPSYLKIRRLGVSNISWSFYFSMAMLSSSTKSSILDLVKLALPVTTLVSSTLFIRAPLKRQHYLSFSTAFSYGVSFSRLCSLLTRSFLMDSCSKFSIITEMKRFRRISWLTMSSEMKSPGSGPQRGRPTRRWLGQ